VNVTTDLSLLSLVYQASLLVKLVMLLLLGVSVVSWWFIFRKAFILRDTRRRSEDFERTFWSGPDLNQLFQSIVGGKRTAASMDRIFEAGFREFVKLRRQTGLQVAVVMDGTRRAMRATYQREMDYLESHLSFLATVGSVSPYVGLLGTVWGIMNAFRGLANVQQATLGQVAPGIAEALIATAIGLFAAIPAVVAFNYYAREIEQLSTRFETFMEEFSNILQRQGGGAQPA
jgi:biopolymer transport protein TolQ